MRFIERVTSLLFAVLKGGIPIYSCLNGHWLGNRKTLRFGKLTTKP